MDINNILKQFSHPRIDVLIITQSVTARVMRIKKELQKKHYITCVLTQEPSNTDAINVLFDDNHIFNDFLKRTYIALRVDTDININDKYVIDVYPDNTCKINDMISDIRDFLSLVANTEDKMIENILSICMICYKKNYKIVATVSHMDEITIKLCTDAINNQSIPIDDLRVVQGKTPMCNSFNTCLEYALESQADILYHTASDVIANPWALKELLRIYDPTVHANVLSFGEDIIMKQVKKPHSQHSVCGIWIFNMGLFKNEEFRFRNEMKQDMKLFARIKEATGMVVGDNLNHYVHQGYINGSCLPLFGYRYEQMHLGIHHPIWTMNEMFKKCYYSMHKWTDTYLDDMRMICKDYLKYNPDNNPLLIMDYVFNKMEKKEEGSKDPEKLEKLYNEVIDKLSLPNDPNISYFVYHDKYKRVCNDLYGVDLKITPLDSIYNDKKHRLLCSETSCILSPLYSTHRDVIIPMKGAAEVYGFNITYATLHEWILIINVYLWLKGIFCVDIDIHDKVLRKVVTRYISTDNYDPIVSQLLIVLYDVISSLPDALSNERLAEPINYIMLYYDEHKPSLDKKMIYEDIIDYMRVYGDHINIIDTDITDHHVFIHDDSLILSSSFEHQTEGGVIFIREKNKTQNHYFKLSHMTRRIVLYKNKQEEKRKILLKYDNTAIIINQGKMKLKKGNEISSMQKIQIVDCDKYYLLFIDSSDQITLMYRSNDGIRYNGSHSITAAMKFSSL